MKKRRFVILDRDGTIIAERNYLSKPEQVELLPNAAAGLREMAALGLGLVIVTNQSGVGRGYFDLAALEKVHARLAELLAAEGVRLDGICFCPHIAEDKCACRKPLPGLLHKAAGEFNFVPRECFVIGDKACDIDLGRAVGATTFLVETGYGADPVLKERIQADYTAADLLAAARLLGKLLPAAAGVRTGR